MDNQEEKRKKDIWIITTLSLLLLIVIGAGVYLKNRGPVKIKSIQDVFLEGKAIECQETPGRSVVIRKSSGYNLSSDRQKVYISFLGGRKGYMINSCEKK